MDSPTRPQTPLGRNRPTAPPVSSLDSTYSSTKSTCLSQSKPSTSLFLPPPSQRLTAADTRKKRHHSRSSSTITTTTTTPSSLDPNASTFNASPRKRPLPRPVGVPRPPTATKSPRKRPRDHSTWSPRQTLDAPPSTLLLPPSPPPQAIDPRILHSLATTDWRVLDPDNHFLLNSSRLFQVSHLELGEISRQQNNGKDPRYGESKFKASRQHDQRKKNIESPTKNDRRAARELLDRLEQERLERIGTNSRADPKGKCRQPELGHGDIPSWAKDREGTEWETSLLKKLSARLASWTKGEEFIPLVWVNDLETKIKRAYLNSLDCWILGKEFPCKRVVLVGWILESVSKDEENGRRTWIYTIDDGTGLIEVECPIGEDGSKQYRPDSRTSVQPVLDPRLLIPKLLLPSPSTSSSCASNAQLSPGEDFRLRRRYSHLEETSTSNRTTFPIMTLVRIVGSISPPKNMYQTELRVTADRMETVSPNQEIEHHSMVNELWNRVYSREVDVRGMLNKIEKKERELKREREAERDGSPSSSVSSCSSYGEMTSSTAASNGDPARKYRPTRPSKLATQDITLTNFVVYIRHYLVKHYVRTSSLLAEDYNTPPPSSQSGPRQGDEDQRTKDHSGNLSREEWCLPFDLGTLRTSNKHLELFARRLSFERDRKERDKKKQLRESRRREGDFALLDATNHSRGVPKGVDQRQQVGDEVWISARRAGLPRAVQGNGVGSSKLVRMMLPPPVTTIRTPRKRPNSTGESEGDETLRDDEDDDELGRELSGKRLEKETTRCWEDAIRMMRKNGMIVEYDGSGRESSSGEEEEEEAAEAGTGIGVAEINSMTRENDRRNVLPDEPSHGINYTRSRAEEMGTPRQSMTRRSRGNEDDTPRAGSHRSSHPTLGSDSGRRRASTSRRQKFQLVTPVSLAPFILEHIQQIAQSKPVSCAASSSSSSSRLPRSSSRMTRRSVTELDIRLNMYRDDRWSAVAKYGEVVKRSLEVLSDWEEIVQTGEGYKIA